MLLRAFAFSVLLASHFALAHAQAPSPAATGANEQRIQQEMERNARLMDEALRRAQLAVPARPGTQAATTHAPVDRNSQAVDEAMRRMNIPQGRVDIVPQQSEGDVNLDPARISELYQSLRSKRSDPARPISDIVLFVSFSMPAESLKRFAEQASRARVPMLFRGLRYGMGPVETKKSLEEFKIFRDYGASISINPDLFDRYDVRQVPVLAVTAGVPEGCDSTECAPPPVKVLGDASLDYLLDQVADRKDAYGASARAALQRMQVRR